MRTSGGFSNTILAWTTELQKVHGIGGKTENLINGIKLKKQI